uniref:Reelin domain-containing protein n=1 Tax=Plectus sambesii TaxID=2011161 RepID=A0A914XSN7_9BILA
MRFVYNGFCVNVIAVIAAVIVETAHGWPDGAPCLRNTLESMSPLEAEEHQGGLQLTPPPFEIILDTSCYRSGEPIRVTLIGKNGTTFKGFALQARVYEGSDRDPTQRIGEFFREDDNGAWRFQCFRYRDGITHSYPIKKKKLEFNWQTDDDDGQNVQFVATVVEHVKRFWLRSVVSEPIPPCRFASHFGHFVPRPITAPPAVKRTKFGLLNNFNSDIAPETAPVEPGIEVKPESIEKSTPPPFVPPPPPPQPPLPPLPPPQPPATTSTISFNTLPPPVNFVQQPAQNAFIPPVQRPPPFQQSIINSPFQPPNVRTEIRAPFVPPNPNSRPNFPRPDFRFQKNPFSQNRFVIPQQTFVQQQQPRPSFERVAQPIIQPLPAQTPPPVPTTQPLISRPTSAACK